MAKPKSRAGRPRSEFTERLRFRHSPEQLELWALAAGREQRELDNWIRVTLDTAARKARKR